MHAVMASSHPVLRRILPPITLHPGVVGVRGTLYDVRNWAVSHPGGAFLVRAYDGCDATRLYETHHLDVARSDAALARLPVVGTYAPLAPPVGRAYEGAREAARALLPTRASRRAPWGVACARALVVVACALAHLALLLVREPWGATWVFALAVSALCNTLVGALGHNAVHTLRPLALGLDWNGLSAYEWLHEHVHSHHMYTNTPMDHDAVSMLPFLSWLPADAKPAVGAKPRGGRGAAAAAAAVAAAALGAYAVYAVGELVVAAQGTVVHRLRWRAGRSAPAWLRHAPWLFVARAASHVLAQGWTWHALASFLFTMTLASFYFSTLAHYSHAGVAAPTGDFLCDQLANTTDVGGALGRAPLLGLYLDRQRLHHLFPAVDHARLLPTLAHLVPPRRASCAAMEARVCDALARGAGRRHGTHAVHAVSPLTSAPRACAASVRSARRGPRRPTGRGRRTQSAATPPTARTRRRRRATSAARPRP